MTRCAVCGTVLHFHAHNEETCNDLPCVCVVDETSPGGVETWDYSDGLCTVCIACMLHVCHFVLSGRRAKTNSICNPV